MTAPRILRVREVAAATTLSRSTLHRLTRTGQFPAPLRLSPGRIGWPEAAVREWLEARTPRAEEAQ